MIDGIPNRPLYVYQKDIIDPYIIIHGKCKVGYPWNMDNDYSSVFPWKKKQAVPSRVSQVIIFFSMKQTNNPIATVLAFIATSYHPFWIGIAHEIVITSDHLHPPHLWATFTISLAMSLDMSMTTPLRPMMGIMNDFRPIMKYDISFFGGVFFFHVFSCHNRYLFFWWCFSFYVFSCHNSEDRCEILH